VKIAVLGGTGSFGRALAVRLREAGEEISIGSRNAARAVDSAAELGVSGGANEDVAGGADLVILAVKADAALETAADLRDALGRTPVLSVASELRFAADGVRPAKGAESIAERVAGLVAGPVVAGLHSFAARTLAAGLPDEDALVCGDDLPSKELVLGLAASICSGRAIDAGPLANARALEGLTSVIVNVNRRYKAHAGIRLTGLP